MADKRRDPNPDETSKARDFEDLSEKHGQDPEEVAGRMGTTGRDLGVGPGEGGKPRR